MEIIDFIEASGDRFTDADRRIIGQALERFDASDPFWFARSIRHEMAIGALAVREGLAQDDIDPHTLEEVAHLALDLLSATDSEFERIWASLPKDRQATNDTLKATLTEIRQYNLSSRERLDWLREWASQ